MPVCKLREEKAEVKFIMTCPGRLYGTNPGTPPGVTGRGIPDGTHSGAVVCQHYWNEGLLIPPPGGLRELTALRRFGSNPRYGYPYGSLSVSWRIVYAYQKSKRGSETLRTSSSERGGLASQIPFKRTCKKWLNLQIKFFMERRGLALHIPF